MHHMREHTSIYNQNNEVSIWLNIFVGCAFLHFSERVIVASQIKRGKVTSKI